MHLLLNYKLSSFQKITFSRNKWLEGWPEAIRQYHEHKQIALMILELLNNTGLELIITIKK